MKYPQIVVYESDGSLASMLEPLARENAWLIRESRQAEACFNLLRQIRCSVLVLKFQDLVTEFDLLARVNRLIGDVPTILVSDVKLDGTDQRGSLAGLAYDLGASYVMFPPIETTLLEDLVSGLMAATIGRMGGSVAEGSSDA